MKAQVNKLNILNKIKINEIKIKANLYFTTYKMSVNISQLFLEVKLK